MKINLRTLLRRFFITISLLFLLLLVATMGLMLFGVTVDLGFLKGGVESSARSALGREVTIDGPVVLEFSDWPSIEVQGFRIANVPNASQPYFLHAGLARLEIGFFPLLKGDIQIGEITAENVSLSLESDENGQPNWVFGKEKDKAEKAKEPSSPPDTTSSQKDEETIRFSLKDLTLKNIAVTYHDAALNKTLRFKLDKMYGVAAPGKPIRLDFEGELQEKKYDLELVGSSIEELLDKNKLWQFTMKGVLLGKKIQSKGNITLRDKEPEANLKFVVKDIDVGAVLSKLGLIKDLRASTGSMGINLSLKGNSLEKVIRQSSMAFSVNDGMWRIESPTSDAYLDVEDLNGKIFVEQGNEVTMKLEGMVGDFPVNFVITGAPLVEYVTSPKSMPLTLDAEFADSILSFASELALPITTRDLSLLMAFETANLENLNEVFRLDLPPIGPIVLETQLQLKKQEYDLSKLYVQIGESRLAGKMTLDVSQEKPKADIELISELIRLDDIEHIWKKTEKDEPGADEAKPEEKVPVERVAEGVTDKKDEKEMRNLLSRKVLNSLEAELLVEAKQVVSGEDSLGSGMLNVSLQDGQLAAKPLQFNVPGGGVQVDLDYLPLEENVTINLIASIEKFDIGILARRTKPDTDMGGAFTLDAALHSTAPDPKSIMKHANGHFDFLLVPVNFSAGILDLWAVNLLSAIMTKVSEKEKSKINCVVVRFGIEEGLMEENAIYMDTSNMRVNGKGVLDFGLEKLDFMLVPKAKKPEFFSLAVPIKVQGTFEDFGLGIGKLRLTSSLVSFITSPVHVPLRRIFVDEIPADGLEACRQAWAITGKEN